MATLDTKLTELAAGALAAHGLVLVQARLTGGSTAGSAKKGKMTLNVMAETAEGNSPTVEQCTEVSRTLSAQLDVADLIAGAYTLEVGSAGLERPLVTPADYVRFVGKQAKITFNRAKKLPTAKGPVAFGSVVGQILPAPEGTVSLQPVDMPEPITVPFADIHHAHLSPSKEELAAMMKAANARPSLNESDND
jgi:ribosome maturation factor RimP